MAVKGIRSIVGCLSLLLLGGAQVIAAQEPDAGELVREERLTHDNLSERFADAELVAQVQIAGVHRDVDNALSEPGMVAILGYVYSAVSKQVWKGEANKLIAFRLGLDACDRKLKKGARYLIFASPDSYGRLQLRSCEAVIPEAEAASLLALLKQFQMQG